VAEVVVQVHMALELLQVVAEVVVLLKDMFRHQQVS
jgi:hypothetical protein